MAATDGTAIFALDYLKAHAPGRVGRIAICGFDNSLRAAIGNITSYSFDAAGFINQALTIAMGQMSRASASQRVVEWPGQVIVRGTTPKPNA